ncbi:alkanesulfonate monooxygenase SsuD/methylene tetrahydromethanopterin reductase-like flavin-dependent oxidoreductase (luciferase family) [Bradyrhizobium sp. RT6a]|uniref:hypothetical protein n=1 Tax=Bradyrhizobium sp. RT6a TaxID=3156381 RepID=UPI003397EA30
MDYFRSLSDYFLIQMYENILRELHVDLSRGTRLVGDADQRADQLRREIDRRGLFCKPIVWPVLKDGLTC